MNRHVLTAIVVFSSSLLIFTSQAIAEKPDFVEKQQEERKSEHEAKKAENEKEREARKAEHEAKKVDHEKEKADRKAEHEAKKVEKKEARAERR